MTFLYIFYKQLIFTDLNFKHNYGFKKNIIKFNYNIFFRLLYLINHKLKKNILFIHIINIQWCQKIKNFIIYKKQLLY